MPPTHRWLSIDSLGWLGGAGNLATRRQDDINLVGMCVISPARIRQDPTNSLGICGVFSWSSEEFVGLLSLRGAASVDYSCRLQ